MLDVDSVIVFVAQYLLFIMAAGLVAFWLLAEDRPGKIRLGGAAVLGLIMGLIFLLLAAKVRSDPRPFVQNTALHPLFSHARDNGFPSDHSLAAGLIAVLVLLRNWRYGVLFVLAAFCVAASRVAAHVHHVQDVVAGLVLGGIAALIGYYAVGALLAVLASRTSLPLTQARPDAGARHAVRTSPGSHRR